jgi:hypothetical protein
MIVNVIAFLIVIGLALGIFSLVSWASGVGVLTLVLTHVAVRVGMGLVGLTIKVLTPG